MGLFVIAEHVKPKPEPHNFSFLFSKKIKMLEKLIVLGSGTSEGIPRVTCLTDIAQNCKVCLDANPHKQNSNERSKNFRRNTSLLLQIQNPNAIPFEEQSQKEGWFTSWGSPSKLKNPFYYVVIDVGKFFYPSAMEWFPKYGITHIDAVLISHFHADAANGIDDLRDWCIPRWNPSSPKL